MFQNHKTTQAVAYILKREGGAMPYLALMKLLYLADKRVLVTSGLPMTFDSWYALDHGPVLSQTLNLITGRHGSPDYWNAHIEKAGYDLRLVRDPGDDLLSEFEEEAMDSIIAEHMGKDRWALRDLTHELPEWQNPDGSSIPISYDDVLRYEGFSESDIKRIKEDINFARFTASSSAPGAAI